ncbi:MAG: arginase family protein [Anaerovoracaceae bacterium]|jgi:arginase
MLNIVIPQWQGGGQDLSTWYGAFALRDRYLDDKDTVTVDIGKNDISPMKNNILGYEDIIQSMDKVSAVLNEKRPSKIFTVGGGCDADTPCAAWLNRKYNGDMAVVYIDAHGDLNTPETSESKLYYGMSLRALLSECDPGIVSRLASTIHADQLIMCAGRDYDPEEIRYVSENGISAFSVEQLEQDPEAVAKEIISKGIKHVYIHVDLDSLDPEEFSLTPVPEPEGLKGDTLNSILMSVKASGVVVVGMGLTEYAGTAGDGGSAIVESLVSFGTNI